MQIEDILKAAIKNAGLDTNIDLLDDPNELINIADDLNFSSTSSSNSSHSSTELSFSNEQHMPHDYSSNDLDNLMMSDESDPFLMALKELDEHNNKINYAHPNMFLNSNETKSIQEDSINSNNMSTECNLEFAHELTNKNGHERKIIRLNSSDNKSMVSSTCNAKCTNDIGKVPIITTLKTQPPVSTLSKLNSLSHAPSIVYLNGNNKKDNSDLNSLINYRAINVKLTNTVTNSNQKGPYVTATSPSVSISSQPNATTLQSQLGNVNNKQSIKVINLTSTPNNQINFKPINSVSPVSNSSNIASASNGTNNSSSYKSTENANGNKILKIENVVSLNKNASHSNACNSGLNVSPTLSTQTPTSTSTTNATNQIRITKVVSSRPLTDTNNGSNNNTGNVYQKTSQNNLATIRIYNHQSSPNLNKTVINSSKNVNASNVSTAKFYSNGTNCAQPIFVNKLNTPLTMNPRYLININNSTNSNNKTVNNAFGTHSNSTNNLTGLNSMHMFGNHHHHNNNNGLANTNDQTSLTPTRLMFNSMIEQDEEVVVEEEEELGHAETYANYMPSKLQIGLRHPDPIVETSSLASVQPPDVWYKLKMPESVYANGALSALQLEAIVYACQKHNSYLPNNHRCGFLVGDGAGVGKGRTIAGIIYENYLLGRKKALWLSVSNDLKFDAQRDFVDIGAHKIKVHALNKLKYTKISSKQNSKIKKGVIFSTYSSLIGESQHKSTKKKYSTRLKQLLEWLGGESYDGVIVFDECHKAKNLVPCGSAKPTKTGLAVLELQEKLPNARIVYASATGASEPKNMAYMVRLGLWGSGTPFSDFNDFIQSIEKRGVGAMEIVAMDMKLRGMYIARQLSFSGVTFKIQEIPLKHEFIKVYDDAVKLWVTLKEKFQEALELIDHDGKLRKTVWGQFWSSHQRFFKYLCLSSKVPYVVELARKALVENKCVVIGLQSTGEARTLEQLDEYGEVNEFVSTTRGVLQNLVEKHFPTCDAVGLSGTGNPLTSSNNASNQKKEAKNSQRINEILQRLSTYTNKKDTNVMLNKSESNKARSTSLSSNDYDEANNSSDFSFDLSSDEYSLFESESGLSEDGEDDDEEDGDDIDDDDDEEEDLRDMNDSDTRRQEASMLHLAKNEPNDSGISSITINNPFDSVLKCGFDSDDSDSLFSITKSVSIQSMINKNQTSNATHDANRKRSKREMLKLKRKKLCVDSSSKSEDTVDKTTNVDSSSRTQIDEEERRNDESLGLTVKRMKSEENEVKQAKPKPTKPHEINEYLNEMKSDLLDAIRTLGKRLPSNTLDELIDMLDGPEHVAEMTGRRGRIVCNGENTYIYETRNEGGDVPMELLNVIQKEQFMNGDKLIAIISEAASSGISLQANRRYANQFRRVHITLELPWSADRAIQQFGRTHRSNQVNAPEYIFLISELAGEKRFASTVAKRLESLGALTHGDRRATESRDLSRFNIDNKYGRAALENLIKSICNQERPLANYPKTYTGDFMSDAREALIGAGMIVKSGNMSAYPDKDYYNINKFLNRLLGCPVLLQNAIFQFFSDILAAVILEAKRNGKWDLGILDLGSNNEIAFKKETKYYVLDEINRVELHTVLVERGLTWDKALDIFKENNLENNFDLVNSKNTTPSGFYISNQVKNGHRLVVLAISAQGSNEKTKSFLIYRPNSGLQSRQETPDSLLKKYKYVSAREEVRTYWIEHYMKSASQCTHLFRQGHCTNIKSCEVGLRTRKFHVLAGSVLTVWTKVENVLCSLTGSSQFRLQIIRVKTNDNQKIVGCVIPSNCLKQIDSLLLSMSNNSYVHNHLSTTTTTTTATLKEFT